MTQHRDEFQVPTFVDADCQPTFWNEVECEISCNVGYESLCTAISYKRTCPAYNDGPCSETGISSCSQLGPGFTQVSSNGYYSHRFLRQNQKCCTCQLSQVITPSTSRTTSATTTTESATPTASTEAGGPGRTWEFVGGPFNRACRGQGYGDASSDYYDVFPGTDSLADCQSICLQQGSRCKGVEYSTGRCEVWHREEGIWAFAEPAAAGNFTCMRYGWPAQYLIPVDGGVNRA